MADDLLSLQYDQKEFPVESVLKEIVKSAMVTALQGPGLSKALEVTCPFATAVFCSINVLAQIKEDLI